MAKVLRATLLAAASLCAAGACQHDLGIANDPTAQVLVLGTVNDSVGSGVPDVALAFAAVPGTQCDLAVTFGNPITTNSSGQYQASLLILAGEFDGCLRLQVKPAAGSGFLADTVDRAGVRFRGGGFRDTVRVDVVLQAGP